MLIIEDYKEITNEKSYFIITVKYDKNFPLLKVNFDIDSETIEVEGNQYTVNDCLVSDNGEWINLICDRISCKRDKERQRIGQRFADVRKETEWVDANGIKRKGMTQTELAERCGLLQSNIARVERGYFSVGFDTLEAMAEGLGKKIDIV